MGKEKEKEMHSGAPLEFPFELLFSEAGGFSEVGEGSVESEGEVQSTCSCTSAIGKMKRRDWCWVVLGRP